MRGEQRWLWGGERISCLLLIAWLQFVGWNAQSIVHHLLQAAPLVFLLLMPASSERTLTGMLAGYLWIFMFAGVMSMVYLALYLEDAFARPDLLGNCLAIATVLASLRATFNTAMLAHRAGLLISSIAKTATFADRIEVIMTTVRVAGNITGAAKVKAQSVHRGIETSKKRR